MRIDRSEIDGWPWHGVASSQIEAAVNVTADKARELGADEAVWQGPERPGRHDLLLVRFKGGAIYGYAVPDPQALADLLAADSPGRQLNAAVKGVFPYTKVEVIDA